MSDKPEIDKEQHYGRYQRQEDRRSSLGMKVAHKALDIPESDMDIQANKTGIGALGVAGVALASSIVPALLGAFMLFKDAPKQADQPPAAKLPAAQEFDITFKVIDGKLQPIEAKQVKP